MRGVKSFYVASQFDVKQIWRGFPPQSKGTKLSVHEILTGIAHGAGVTHRDIKPDNMRDGDDTAYFKETSEIVIGVLPEYRRRSDVGRWSST